MINEFHILNGDSLKQQFHKETSGITIIMRECLIENFGKGETLEQFFESRSSYMMATYNISKTEYQEKTIDEVSKIEEIPKDADINLWFEDDLFCQTNLWFLIHHLYILGHNNLYLVRPQIHTKYGFGGLSSSELKMGLEQRIKLKPLDKLSILWTHYNNNDLELLLSVAESLCSTYPFIKTAVEAHIKRHLTTTETGKPERIVQDIISELNTKDFGTVLQEFQNRAPIYGFGDLQLKRIFERIVISK